MTGFTQLGATRRPLAGDDRASNPHPHDSLLDSLVTSRHVAGGDDLCQAGRGRAHQEGALAQAAPPVHPFLDDDRLRRDPGSLLVRTRDT